MLVLKILVFILRMWLIIWLMMELFWFMGLFVNKGVFLMFGLINIFFWVVIFWVWLKLLVILKMLVCKLMMWKCCVVIINEFWSFGIKIFRFKLLRLLKWWVNVLCGCGNFICRFVWCFLSLVILMLFSIWLLRECWVRICWWYGIIWLNKRSVDLIIGRLW